MARCLIGTKPPLPSPTFSAETPETYSEKKFDEYVERFQLKDANNLSQPQ